MEESKIEQKYIDGILHTLCGCGTCGQYFVSHENTNGTGEVRYKKGHYCIGKHPTKESIEKNRAAHIGKPSQNKGKKATDETRLKIKIARATQVMKKGRHHTAESNEKNRIAHLGKRHTEESKKKLSDGMMGKSKSDEHKRNIGKSKSGANNPSWLGGISKLPYTQDWTEDLKDAVRKRDNYTCQICGISQDDLNDKFHKKLPIHHIDYNKDNCNPLNLISLCVSCHMKTNRKREQWTDYFINNKKQKEFAMAVNK